MQWNQVPLCIISLIKQFFSERKKRTLINVICKSWKNAPIYCTTIEIPYNCSDDMLIKMMDNICTRSVEYWVIPNSYLDSPFTFSINSIIGMLTNLKELDLNDNNITDNILVQISELNSLHTLNLSGCTKITKFGFQHLSNLKLKSINLSSLANGYVLEYVSSIETLEKLSITGRNIRDENFRYMGKLKGLIYLYIAWLDKITDAALQYFFELTMIEKISIYECNNITDAGIKYISMQVLSDLTISGHEDFHGDAFKDFANLDLLERLDIGQTGITDNGLEYLQKCSSLEDLDLSQCFNFTDIGLYHVSKIQSLLILNLHSNDITDLGLEYLSKLENLEELSLRRCSEITDDGLLHLGKISTLEKLDLFDCCYITDNGMKHLSNLRKLQRLNIVCCNEISDIGIKYLSDIETLYCIEK